MRKKVFKAIAGCAAACFMAGLIAVSGGNKDASAEDNYIANYTFEDGVTGDFMNNGLKINKKVNSYPFFPKSPITN